jgi:hypothetical protein
VQRHAQTEQIAEKPVAQFIEQDYDFLFESRGGGIPRCFNCCWKREPETEIRRNRQNREAFAKFRTTS